MKNIKYCIAVLAFSLSACASIPSTEGTRLLIQYSVLKTAEESDSIHQESILSATNRIRQIVESNESIALAAVSSEIREHVNYDALTPSDRLLVNALMVNMENIIQRRMETDVIDSGSRKSVLEIIDIIEQAARLI